MLEDEEKFRSFFRMNIKQFSRLNSWWEGKYENNLVVLPLRDRASLLHQLVYSVNSRLRGTQSRSGHLQKRSVCRKSN